jgi:tRNA(Ile)-lysidine synthase
LSTRSSSQNRRSLRSWPHLESIFNLSEPCFLRHNPFMSVTSKPSLKLMPYEYRFSEHVWSFLQTIPSCPVEGTVVVAVSGGVDSLSLLELAYVWYQLGRIQKLHVLTIDHQTRAGQVQDCELVQNFCLARGLTCELQTLQMNSSQQKVSEHRLHQERYKIFEALLENFRKKGERPVIWLAHHLNDSWEWSQMQALKSSDPFAGRGLAKRAHSLWRPFLCVTREQIEKWARSRKLQWREDPTNQDTQIERNFIRHKIHSTLLEKYPQHLKHYAHQQQRTWVTQQERHPRKLLLTGAKNVFQPQSVHTQEAWLLFEEKQLLNLLQQSSTAQAELTAWIKKFSKKGKGKLFQEIHKCLQALTQGRRGPFSFSGGVGLYRWENHLWIFKKELWTERLRDYDKNSFQVLPPQSGQSFTFLELKELLESFLRSPQKQVLTGQGFPFWFSLETSIPGQPQLPAAHDPHFLPPKKPAIHIFKLLKYWRQKNRPLWLFPFFDPQGFKEKN